MPDDTERNRRVVLEYLEVFRTCDPGRYERFLTDDPVYQIGQTVHRGQEGFRRVARFGKELHPNGAHPEIESVVAEGDSVAVRMIMRAVTNKGVDYENTYLLWFELEGGLIARQWELMDFASPPRSSCRRRRERAARQNATAAIGMCRSSSSTALGTNSGRSRSRASAVGSMSRQYTDFAI